MTALAEGFPSDGLSSSFKSWAEVPSELLQAELARRQQNLEKPECGSGNSRAYYNTPLHVIALIIILVLSVGACSFPIIVRRFPRLPVPHHFLFLSRHFGTGVLIATAFVHLLPTAFTSLTDPCLPSFWNIGYPAMPGLIAMSAVLVVVGIEMFFATRGAGHSHASEFGSFPSASHGRSHDHGSGPADRPRTHRRTESLRRFRDVQLQPLNGAASDGAGAISRPSQDRNRKHPEVPSSKYLSPLPRKNVSDSEDEESELELDELVSPSIQGDSARLLGGEGEERHKADDDQPLENGTLRPGSLSKEQQQKKMLLQCLLLEAGILFHSVFIGMALSVATGTAFIVLLVAISFHQTFEGLALGSRIAALEFPPQSIKPWLMALEYGTTTPLGQAIGLAIHTLYDPASQTGLLTVGVMNAISSGLLLFAGLVELLAEDFLSDESYETLTGRRRLEACASVVGGAALMALVGAWA